MVTVAVALAAAVIALLGNVVLDPLNVGIFAVYCRGTLAVGVMFQRAQLLRFVLPVPRTVVERVQQVNAHARERVIAQIQEINARGGVLLAAGDDLEILNRAVALRACATSRTANLEGQLLSTSESEIPSGPREHAGPQSTRCTRNCASNFSRSRASLGRS